MQMHSPVHPGTILCEYMGDTIDVTTLSSRLGMTPTELETFIAGGSAVTNAMAQKLADTFPNTQPDLWIALQRQFNEAKLRQTKTE